MRVGKQKNARRRSGVAARLHALFHEYLEETCHRFPEYGSRLGFAGFRGLLGRNLPQDHRAQIALTRRILAEVEALPSVALAGDDWLDRKTFLSLLRTRHIFDDRLSRWRTNPQLHAESAVDSLLDLIIQSEGKIASVAAQLRSRLRSIPDYLEGGLACLHRPDPLWTQLTLQLCEGAAEFSSGLGRTLAAHEREGEESLALAARAQEAFLSYAARAAKKTPGPQGGFAVGRSVFEELIRERLGFSWTLPEAVANGRALILQLRADLQREASRLGHRSARAALEQAAEQWNPAGSLLECYRNSAFRLREKLCASDFVTLPEGEKLEIRPVPAFLRHQFPTAAYSAPPPFSRKQLGVFWVNDLSLTASNARAAARERAQHYGLDLTCAHEAYPGHHLQFVMQNRHPSKIRRLADHGIFYEGWTMWCEQQMIEQGWIEDPLAKLTQLHDALWRAHRIVIDCGLQSGEMSYAQACRELSAGVGFTRARAKADVNWYTSSPTVPMSYLLGRLEVEKLHRYLCKKEGWSLRRFHDWVLGFGAIPWSWIRESHWTDSEDSTNSFG
jgi:uncharacterized protein (DUF885 family)